MDRLAQLARHAQSSPRDAVRLVTLISADAAHPGAGACYIDGAVPDVMLETLQALFQALPLAARVRESQGRNERAYYCDVDGSIGTVLQAAVHAAALDASRRAGDGQLLPCAGESLPQMRFLCYAEAGGGLAPHTDLSRTRRADNRTSRCTFILYLTDCASGGRTVLLERLLGGRAIAEVEPRRGRLLLFPHLCPHRADEVVAEGLPKLLLRGEMI